MGIFTNYFQDDPRVTAIIEGERKRQQDALNFIASENYASREVMLAQATCLANKYAEGYPGKRYYAGCEFVDQAEELAINRAKELFAADYVNVQPHSGAQANGAVYQALLNPGDKMLGMSLTHGGHLTHGFKMNSSGKTYQAFSYGVTENGQDIDYDQVARLAIAEKPKLIIAGFSAFSGEVNWARFREIADEVGAYLLADMAHIAGLVAAKIIDSPLPYADVVTCTTHKTLRGPRGGMILNQGRPEVVKLLQSGVFPGLQGGAMMHTILAKAVAFKEALQPEFIAYQKQVVANSQALAAALTDNGFKLVNANPLNHMVLVDLRGRGYSGRQAAIALERAKIIVNKNTIPGDVTSAMETSGLRLGTPAVTTRGMGIVEMQESVGLLTEILSDINSSSTQNIVAAKVVELCSKYPLVSL